MPTHNHLYISRRLIRELTGLDPGQLALTQHHPRRRWGGPQPARATERRRVRVRHIRAVHVHTVVRQLHERPSNALEDVPASTGGAPPAGLVDNVVDDLTGTVRCIA